MSETKFDINNVEPDKINLIGDGTEEQPPEGTPQDDSANAEQPPPVQATPADSEVYKNLQAAFTKTSQENSELRSRLASLEDRLAQPAPTPQNSFQQPQQPPAEDELDKSVKDYEELKPFAKRIQGMERNLQNQQIELDEAKGDLADTRRKSAQEIHAQKVLSAHPDAIEVSNSPDFIGWAQRQPEYVQRAISTGTAESINSILTQYKAGKSQLVDAAREVAAPDNPTPPVKTTDSNTRDFTAAEIDAMSYEDFAKNEEAIDAAAREGRIS